MARILVHATHGPENPTRAALALLVARTAAEEGHDVSVFLAGDAVWLMREAVLDHLVGLGTGRAREHMDALRAAGVAFHVSGLSAKARGITENDLVGTSATFAMPKVLVQLSLEHDRMFNY